jgi:hypothetical protein
MTGDIRAAARDSRRRRDSAGSVFFLDTSCTQAVSAVGPRMPGLQVSCSLWQLQCWECAGHCRARRWATWGTGPGDRAGKLGGVESQETWASHGMCFWSTALAQLDLVQWQEMLGIGVEEYRQGPILMRQPRLSLLLYSYLLNINIRLFFWPLWFLVRFPKLKIAIPSYVRLFFIFSLSSLIINQSNWTVRTGNTMAVRGGAHGRHREHLIQVVFLVILTFHHL